MATQETTRYDGSTNSCWLEVQDSRGEGNKLSSTDSIKVTPNEWHIVTLTVNSRENTLQLWFNGILGIYGVFRDVIYANGPFSIDLDERGGGV